MNIRKMVTGKLYGASYKAVAAVMKNNYIGMAKKYKDTKLDEYAEKIGLGSTATGSVEINIPISSIIFLNFFGSQSHPLVIFIAKLK